MKLQNSDYFDSEDSYWEEVAKIRKNILLSLMNVESLWSMYNLLYPITIQTFLFKRLKKN